MRLEEKINIKIETGKEVQSMAMNRRWRERESE